MAPHLADTPGHVDPAALAARVEELAATPAGESLPQDAEHIVFRVLDALETGEVRSARRDEHGHWSAVPWVKRGILLAFRAGAVVDMSPPGGVLRFFDKRTIPPRLLTVGHGIRVVPGGRTSSTSSIRATVSA